MRKAQMRVATFVGVSRLALTRNVVVLLLGRKQAIAGF